MIYLDFSMALAACWCQELFETIFAIELSLFFDKANVLQWATTATVATNEMIRTPDSTQSRYEWSSA